jgi:uncharacterized protein with PIN domain
VQASRLPKFGRVVVREQPAKPYIVLESAIQTMPETTESLTTKQTQAILAPFNCIEPKTIQTSAEKLAVQQAVLQLVKVTDNQIFGILADSLEQATQALNSYTQVIGHQPPAEISPCSDAVYLKFNPRSGLCYASPYTGEHRGVLISFQSDTADGLNEMCGHLPLDLFES